MNEVPDKCDLEKYMVLHMRDYWLGQTVESLRRCFKGFRFRVTDDAIGGFQLNSKVWECRRVMLERARREIS